jgi:Domain of unknown function (DUF4411)
VTPVALSYAIDTSAILDGWVRYYPEDVFPSVWERLAGLVSAGRIVAPDEVREELKAKLDSAYKWAKGQAGLFVPLDAAVQAAATAVLKAHPKLIDNRPNRMSADPFVVGLAQVRGLTVITGERPTNSPNRPNIPDVCRALNVPCFSMMDLFRAEKWVFA